MTRQLIALACFIAAASACSSKAETPFDSAAAAAPNAGGAGHVNMIQLDTTSRPRASGPTKRPPVRRDSVPVLRDSASGPKLEIDSHGKVRPIKK
jgi:hypothetical protein